MSMYEDFLKSAYVRRLPSGVENEPVNEKKKTKHKKPKEAFNQPPCDESPERMETLKNMLKESQIGRETLEFLKEKGSKLIFEKIDKVYGYFSPDKNIVALNPQFSDEDLAITFVHEVRHARQDSIMKNLDPEMKPDTMLKNGFMIEADACATECVLAHQMIEKGDFSIFEKHQKTPYAGMTTAFEKEFDKSKDWNKARDAAFMEWFNLRVKPGYAQQYVDFMGEIAKESIKQKEEDGCFIKDIDIKQMAKKLCINSKGECYIQNPKKLESPEKLNISEKQAAALVQGLRTFMSKQKRSPERMGMDNIYVKHADGTYTTVHEERKKINVNAALQSMTKGKGDNGR